LPQEPMSAPSSHLPNSDPSQPVSEEAIAVSATVVDVQVISADAPLHSSATGSPSASGESSGQSSEATPSEILLDDVSNRSASPTSGALTTTRGSFSAFLAPLKQDTFKQVVTDVEQKLEVVNQTLSMLDSLLDSQGFDAILNEMLTSITLKTGELLNADRTTIYLLDEDKNELWSIVAKDENGNNLELRFPTSMGIAGESATFKKVINIPFDFYNDPRAEFAKIKDQETGYRTYTMLVLPLLDTQENLVAVVQLINKLKRDYDPLASLDEKIDLAGFTEDDHAVFDEFAPSIRLILESSRSFYKATQRQRAASALMKATKALSESSLDREETLKRVMDEAKELMQADRSTLWLLSEDKTELWTKIPIQGVVQEIRIPSDAGLAGQVATTGEPLIIPFDLYDHKNAETAKKTDEKSGYRTCSMLCMPVFNAKNELIGVTQLINKKRQGDYPDYNPATWPDAPDCWKASFNRNDMEFMKAFNIQAGVALQNAKLFQTVKQQEQMQRDMLRSLSNSVLSTDREGRVIAANESALKLLDLQTDDPIEGQFVRDLIHIEERSFAECIDSALHPKDKQDQEQYYPEQTLLSKPGIADAGEQHSVNLSINSITDVEDENNIYGALVVMDDISDEKRMKSAMYRYMSQEVAEQALSSGELKLGGDRKEVSVLFSDIRSFTTIAESMEAEELVIMLNEYFELMVDAVMENKGTLDKYIGDAIMAVFGSPLKLDDHEYRAVQTSVEMRHRLEGFNRDRQNRNLKPISIGIGLNSGHVISGNIGSSKRLEFTAIGDGVNLSARLEGATKQYGCDIVISENTYEPCKDHVWVRELDRIRVKGKNKSVGIYELVALRDEQLSDAQKLKIERYHQGREYYLAQQFKQAIEEFSSILEQVDGHDKAAQVQLHRCHHWLANPPEENWDGVWSLTEK
ncbi:MAG: adenylate/guanylate cyclase domain-containing protein, partial [Leptolyngbyaceae bacterium]|nr:adenylate/guanylate cyclase domain-containing protein [Leptolyngbyaceae bacterium]